MYSQFFEDSELFAMDRRDVDQQQVNKMRIRLLEYPTQNIIYDHTYNSNFYTEKDLEEHKQEFHKDSYHLNISENWFDGIHINITEIITHGPQYFYYESSHQHVGFLFCLNGSINYFSDKEKKLISLTNNQQNISLAKFNRIAFNITGKASFVYIQLTEAYFNKVTNQCFEEQVELKADAIRPEIVLLIRTMFNPKHEGRLKRIFLESKIFELLISYLQKKETNSIFIKEEDARKIFLAKQIIEMDLQQPCSLMDLSRKVGINDFKLKKGFKALIGNTVFGYLYKIRMERAYYCLLQEKKSVNEVAFLVGYKNAQHFITAFKKYYGLLPGSLNK